MTMIQAGAIFVIDTFDLRVWRPFWRTRLLTKANVIRWESWNFKMLKGQKDNMEIILKFLAKLVIWWIVAKCDDILVVKSFGQSILLNPQDRGIKITLDSRRDSRLNLCGVSFAWTSLSAGTSCDPPWSLWGWLRTMMMLIMRAMMIMITAGCFPAQ